MKKGFTIFIGSFILIFLLTIVGSGLYYFFSISDDKMYGDDNKYVNSELTGDAKESDSNIASGYKFNKEIQGIFSMILKFMLILLKITGIIIIPLMIYYLFLNKDDGAIGIIQKMFSK